MVTEKLFRMLLDLDIVNFEHIVFIEYDMAGWSIMCEYEEIYGNN